MAGANPSRWAAHVMAKEQTRCQFDRNDQPLVLLAVLHTLVVNERPQLYRPRSNRDTVAAIFASLWCLPMAGE